MNILKHDIIDDDVKFNLNTWFMKIDQLRKHVEQNYQPDDQMRMWILAKLGAATARWHFCDPQACLQELEICNREIQNVDINDPRADRCRRLMAEIVSDMRKIYVQNFGEIESSPEPSNSI